MVCLLICVLSLLASMGWGCELVGGFKPEDRTLPQYGHEKKNKTGHVTTPALGLNPANRLFGDPGLCCVLDEKQCVAGSPQKDTVFYQQRDNPQANDPQQQLLNEMRSITGAVQADHEKVQQAVGGHSNEPDTFMTKHSWLRTATQVDVELCNDKSQSYYDAQLLAWKMCKHLARNLDGHGNPSWPEMPPGVQECGTPETKNCVIFQKDGHSKNACTNYEIKYTDRHGAIQSRKLKGKTHGGDGMHEGLLVPKKGTSNKVFKDELCNPDTASPHDTKSCGVKPTPPQPLKCKGEGVEMPKDSGNLYVTQTEANAHAMRQDGLGGSKSTNLLECVEADKNAADCLGNPEITQQVYEGDHRDVQRAYVIDVVDEGQKAEEELEEELRSLEESVAALTETAS